MPHSKTISIDEVARTLAEFLASMHRMYHMIEDLHRWQADDRERIDATVPEAGGRDTKEVIGTFEAAALAHVKPRTIRAWVQKGRLLPIGRGRTYLFRRRDVLVAAKDSVRKRRRELFDRRLRRRKEKK